VRSGKPEEDIWFLKVRLPPALPEEEKKRHEPLLFFTVDGPIKLTSRQQLIPLSRSSRRPRRYIPQETKALLSPKRSLRRTRSLSRRHWLRECHPDTAGIRRLRELSFAQYNPLNYHNQTPQYPQASIIGKSPHPHGAACWV
jgi:hypothetical protein